MLKYWIWLATRKGLTSRELCCVAHWFPSPEAAFMASEKAYKEIPGLRAPKGLLDKDLTKAKQILEACRKKGIEIITLHDASYPEQLMQLADAPIVLYRKGLSVDFNAPLIGVVGTRRASVYGLSQTKKISYGLARSGCTAR